MKKILGIKLRGIGDLILVTPAIDRMKKLFPDSVLSFIAPKETVEILFGNPYIDSFYQYKREKPFELISSLRREKFDFVVNFHASTRSALLAFLSGAKEMKINFYKDSEKQSIVERDINVLRDFGNILDRTKPSIFLFPEERREGERILLSSEYSKEFLVGLGIGASAESKCWAWEKFLCLGMELSKEYNAKILVFLTKREESLEKMMKEREGYKFIWIKDFPIRIVASLLEKCDVYIGNDSGLTHIAVSLGTKTVTLFGPENPLIWHPYKEEDGHIAISKAVDCKGCGKLKCEKLICLNSIEVAEVLEAVSKIQKKFFSH